MSEWLRSLTRNQMGSARFFVVFLLLKKFFNHQCPDNYHNGLSKISELQYFKFQVMKITAFLLLILLPLVACEDAKDTVDWTADRITSFWNFPMDKCPNKFNVSMPVREYNIEHNKEFKFIGDKEFKITRDKVAVLYEYGHGEWPYLEEIKKKDAKGKDVVIRTIVHKGGLPQNVNVKAHLATLGRQIKHEIPEGFNGPAILDVEEWRPMFDQNWSDKRVYQRESRALVRQKHPHITDKKKIDELAIKQFNDASKKLLTESLRLGKQLRPNAKWSMYGFPLCNPHSGVEEGDLKCGYERYNDNLRWLYDEFDILTPSIYLESSWLKPEYPKGADDDGDTHFFISTSHWLQTA
ncbi:hypothetical protein PRIPAC_88674 [Pristionchus pacificus]|nr:hypothetical protein PRIPAC_88674 [Pristionchus pacificus]